MQQRTYPILLSGNQLVVLDQQRLFHLQHLGYLPLQQEQMRQQGLFHR
jgi:hypothetical protein